MKHIHSWDLEKTLLRRYSRKIKILPKLCPNLGRITTGEAKIPGGRTKDSRRANGGFPAGEPKNLGRRREDSTQTAAAQRLSLSLSLYFTPFSLLLIILFQVLAAAIQPLFR